MTSPFEYEQIKYVGSRPKNDQDNQWRKKLCHIVRDVGCFYEICPEKLYMVYLAKDEEIDDFINQVDEKTSPFIFWSARDSPTLHYEPFNMDFGPFNLAVTHQFCSRVKVWLDTQQFRDPDKLIVIVLDNFDLDKKLNTTLLVAISAMVLLGMTDEEVIQRLNFFMMYQCQPDDVSTKSQLIFHEKKKFTDVSGNHSMMTVTLEDCIRAFFAALKFKFYDYYTFDHIEYLFYETVISGDLNWVIPGKLLAFAGPSDNRYVRHSPEFYYHYFKDHNVSSIVRLNDPEYRSATFKKLGFEHHDLIFPDGFPPTSSIAAKFIKIVDEAKGAVAVHCYAGIGRTGTLIATYLMARYNFTPQMAVAWTRICRPGSVIGEQQDWLITKFDPYSNLNMLNELAKSIKNKSKAECVSISHKQDQLHEQTQSSTKVATNYAAAEKSYGQAKALVMTKKQRESSNLDRPRTRNQDKNQFKRTSRERCSLDSDDVSQGKASRGLKRTAGSTILNLGKTVPWCLYEDDIFPLKGKKNPDTYRIYDGKYEWKVKFPRSKYVALRHNYELNMETSESLCQNETRSSRVVLDFIYEEKEATNKVASKKSKQKPGYPSIISDDSGVEISRLQPVVLYTLVSAI